MLVQKCQNHFPKFWVISLINSHIHRCVFLSTISKNLWKKESIYCDRRVDNVNARPIIVPKVNFAGIKILYIEACVYRYENLRW